MALLLETTLGDLVIDLDVEGSPEICKNVLKLAKARYYTSTLVYNVQPNRFCQLGDPQGDGSGGACIYGLISTLLASGTLNNQKVLQSPQRFLKSNMGRPLTPEECQEKGRVVATEMKGIADTIGSQLLITTVSGRDMALDGYRSSAAGIATTNGEDRQLFRSVGVVREDENNVLDQIASTYCDADGRPYADIRIIRALVIDDPFDDPPGMGALMKERGVEMDDDEHIVASPEYERPPEEKVEIRIQADQVDPLTTEEDIEKMREQEEEFQKREDKSRAVVLEMLGDLPDADITAPENVLFVCKLNPVTEDEDLELIFSRFDEKVKAEIIRDQETGSSLQYAFVEFTTKDQAVEAYFKMNNALVDDRRIKVDFSQSVAKVWNKFTQRMRNPAGKRSNQHMPKDPFSDSRGPGHRNGGRPGQQNNNNRGRLHDRNHHPQRPYGAPPSDRGNDHSRQPDRGRARPPEQGVLDSFGRRVPPNRDQNIAREEPRRNDRDRDHRHDDNRAKTRESESDSRAGNSRRKRRSRSESSERRHRKRSHKHHHKDHRKRDRDNDSASDGDQSRDSDRRRDRKRERRHERRDSRERRDRFERKGSPDHSDDSYDRRRSRDHRRHDDSKKHHHDDRDHRRRSDHKERKKRHRKDS